MPGARASKAKGRAEAGPDGIPDKPYFKIGEVAKICSLQPYVLRYWETEFGSLRPEKTKSGQRLYRRRHVLLVLRIRELLYEQRFTIEGARSALRGEGHDEAPPPNLPPPAIDRETLQKFKQGIIDLLALVEQ